MSRILGRAASGFEVPIDWTLSESFMGGFEYDLEVI